jgi:hypothetical protein
MKPVDAVLSVLTLCAVGLGVAAYRAWHPDQPVSQSDVAAATEPLPSRLPSPVVAPRVQEVVPPAFGAVDFRLHCGPNGHMYRTDSRGTVDLGSCNQPYPRGEIHLVTPEEARQVSSVDPSDQ